MPNEPNVVDLKVPDGEMELYSFSPSGPGPHPAVIVVQEIFGVDPHIRDVAQRLADAGYYAAAADLFHRDGKGIVVPYAEMQRGFELRGHITDDGLMADLNAVVAHLKSQTAVRADRIGIIGFCFGGRVTFTASMRVPGLAAAAPFYSGGMVRRPDSPPGTPNLVEELVKVQCPVAGFFGNEDKNPTPAEVDQMEEVLKQAGKTYEFHRYDGAGHGFMCNGRGSYHEHAAKEAWPKVVAFFNRHLKG